MIGAILAMKNASMLDPGYPTKQLVLFDRADYFLGFGFKRALLAGMRVRDEIPHDRDALDQFGHSLGRTASQIRS